MIYSTPTFILERENKPLKPGPKAISSHDTPKRRTLQMLKNKKTANLLIFTITIISILELYAIYTLNMAFKGVYQIGFFVALAIAQPIIFGLLLKNKTTSKFKIGAMVIIALVLPIVVSFTIPDYTYEDGKNILRQSLASNKTSVILTPLPGEYTVPVVENSNHIFIANRVYYYIIKEDNLDKKYFLVNPITGNLQEITEKYW